MGNTKFNAGGEPLVFTFSALPWDSSRHSCYYYRMLLILPGQLNPVKVKYICNLKLNLCAGFGMTTSVEGKSLLKSYILRRHHCDSLTLSNLRCVRNPCRFVPRYEPCSPSPSICSTSSNIRVFHPKKMALFLFIPGSVLLIQFTQHYSAQ